MAISRFATSSVAQGLPKYQKLWDGVSIYTPPSFESIATVSVGSGGISSVIFSSIPQTYKHLQIRAKLRGTASDSAGQSWIRFNDVTTEDYVWHGIYATGGGIGQENSTFTAKDGVYSAFRHPSGTATSGMWGSGICDILNYASSTQYKTVKTLSGYDANGSGQVRLYSGFLASTTNPITKIEIKDQSGSNYAQYSHFALYGIRG